MHKSICLGVSLLACLYADTAFACTYGVSTILKNYKIDIEDLQSLDLPRLELRFQVTEIEDQGNGFPERAGFKTTGEWQDIPMLQFGVLDFDITHFDPKIETKLGWSRRCPDGERVNIAFTVDPGSNIVTRDMIDVALQDYKTLKSNASFLVRRFMPRLKRVILISTPSSPFECKVIQKEGEPEKPQTFKNQSVLIDEFQDVMCNSDQVLALLSE